MDKTLEKICNGKIRKDKKSISLSKGIVKEILLQRYAHSQNNAPLLCQLIENNYITRDKVWEYFGEKTIKFINKSWIYKVSAFLIFRVTCITLGSIFLITYFIQNLSI